MKKWAFLTILVVLCFAARLSFFLLVEPWDQKVREEIILRTDAIGYHRLATSLVEHGRLYSGEDWLDSIRTPGYPLFIAPFYLLFGEQPWVVLLAQIILDALSCVVLFLTICLFLSPRTAFLSCLFFALDPFLILFSSTLLSDTLFVFLLIVASHFFARCICAGFRDCGKQIALSGLFFALATLTRPIAQYLIGAVVLMVFVFLRGELKTALKLASTLLLAYVLVLLPWLIRNETRYGYFALSTSGDYNLLVLMAGPVAVEVVEDSPGRVVDSLMAEADALALRDGKEPDEMGLFDKGPYHREVALSYIAGNPGVFVKRYLFGIVRMFGNLGTTHMSIYLRLPVNTEWTSAEEASPTTLVKQWFAGKSLPEQLFGSAAAVYMLLSYSCALVGLFVARTRLNRWFLVYCVIVGLYFILATGPAGLARFKLPIIPFYAVFAGLGLDRILVKMGAVLRRLGVSRPTSGAHA